jgi:hypothetical protein
MADFHFRLSPHLKLLLQERAAEECVSPSTLARRWLMERLCERRKRATTDPFPARNGYRQDGMERPQ